VTFVELAYGHYRVPVVVCLLPENEFGSFSFYPSPEIKLSLGLTSVVETSTLLHEVMEMINEIHNLGLSEGQIRTLEFSLMTLFLQNPQLLCRLLQPLESAPPPEPLPRYSLPVDSLLGAPA
jgi:hypothetical protein